MGTIIESCAKAADKVRDICPLVHCITNYVTVNDVANCILAIGASPIMADDIAEAADITSISKALVINMGTLNARTVESMVAAGKKANELGVPVVFDPVGAGASNFRNETAKRILENVKISILRGNLSEMSYLAGLEVSTKGVDTSEADEKNDPVSVAKKTAAKYNCVAAITGAVDTITDGKRVARISNGHPYLSRIAQSRLHLSIEDRRLRARSFSWFQPVVEGLAMSDRHRSFGCVQHGNAWCFSLSPIQI